MTKAKPADCGFKVRNYTPSDAPGIAGFNKLMELYYLYHPDFKAENIFCAAGAGGEILGSAHLEYTDTWSPIAMGDKPSDFVHKLRLTISINPDSPHTKTVKEALLDSLIARAGEIRSEYPDKRVRLFLWLDSTDNTDMDFFLDHGFTTGDISLVMKRDLTEVLPEYPTPEGIDIKPITMGTEDELNGYYSAEKKAFEGVVWSLNHVRWMRYGPEWLSFGAFYGDELIGHCMTWMIGEGRNATEDIFVVPEWQGKGISKPLITAALNHLKAEGKSMATLSVHSGNKKAISLYRTLGYGMYYMLVDFGIDL